eukprot:2625912-Alexandrium_andersonii.AAC.1
MHCIGGPSNPRLCVSCGFLQLLSAFALLGALGLSVAADGTGCVLAAFPRLRSSCRSTGAPSSAWVAPLVGPNPRGPSTQQVTTGERPTPSLGAEAGLPGGLGA